jgi:hypothetical protein
MAKAKKSGISSVSYPAPNFKSIETSPGKYGTREWEPGEKAEYERQVLGRDPSTPYPSGIPTLKLKQLQAPLVPNDD